ncbi:MAG TPA: SPFH domain-containing protein [Solirubrobacteraceae bacterium]|nr:SPFH domain-containing protein [Solirubrobacteraceae bacterium]
MPGVIVGYALATGLEFVGNGAALFGVILYVIGGLGWGGLFVVQPNQASVLILFGRYIGSVTEPGFWAATRSPSPDEVHGQLQAELQKRLEIAGIDVLETRLTHLAYAPEIAALMLRRQQAEAIIAARRTITAGATGLARMAVSQLEASDLVELDPERKAAMASNLLVVLCGDRPPRPIINIASLYT